MQQHVHCDGVEPQLGGHCGVVVEVDMSVRCVMRDGLFTMWALPVAKGTTGSEHGAACRVDRKERSLTQCEALRCVSSIGSVISGDAIARWEIRTSQPSAEFLPPTKPIKA
jgi:hypothetical protein